MVQPKKAKMVRFEESNSRNNRGGRDNQRSRGGDRKSSRRNRGNGERNQKRRKENKGPKMEPKAVMTYRKPKLSDKKVTTKFTIYSETDAIKIEHQKYTGKSDYELIKAHKELWAMIDDNELLPVTTGAPDRTRVSQANVIGVYTPPLPDATTHPTERATEVEKRKQHEKQLRKVAFRAARNIYEDETASTAFGSALEEEREIFNSLGATTRSGTQREFYSKRTLETILNAVTKEILGVDAIVNQLKYLKTTKKPKEITCKEWFRALAEIEKSIYWYSEQNYKIDKMVLNQDMIAQNIPLEWRVDFEKTRCHQEVMRNTSNNQPSRNEILEELERLERAESTKREIEKLRNERGNKRGKNNREKDDNGGQNWCRKPGHNHLWKDCPDNPRSTKRNVSDGDRGRSYRRENNAQERSRASSRDHSDDGSVKSNHLMEFIPEEEMPELERHSMSDEEYECEELDYILTHDDNVDEENNNQTYLFENLGMIEPSKECNVLRMQEDSESESDVSTESEQTPQLIIPKKDSNDESSLESLPGLVLHESSDDEDSTTSKENNIANKRERIEKKREVSTRLKATCKFALKDTNGKLTEYTGLLDTGSDGSLIAEELVNKYEMKKMSDRGMWKTNSGNFKTTSKAVAGSLTLPQFSRNREIVGAEFYVNPNAKQKYKAIFGLDFLVEYGVDFINSERKVVWHGIGVPLDESKHESNVLDKSKITDNKYKEMSPKEVVELDNQKHLTGEQKSKLEALLTEVKGLFAGKVGTRDGIKVSFQLKPDAVPHYARPYNIPESLRGVTKNAIQMMCDEGILERTNEDSEWAAPTFAVPKKTAGVRIVSDFRALNRHIKRSPWPMPTTRELLHRVGGMTWVTALDQILSYYTMQMDPKVQKYLTIILPWGKYRYKKCPWGSASRQTFFKEK